MKTHCIRRFVLVKRLVQKNAIDDKSSDEDYGFSILGLHDALEWYLNVAAEEVGITKLQSEQLLSLFDAVHAALDATKQKAFDGYRHGIARFNKARVELKHRGTFPSRQDISGFHSMISCFLDECTPIIFGIQYEDVSLSELIVDADIRAKWIEAESHLKANSHQEFACSLAHMVHMTINKRKSKSLVDEGYEFRPHIPRYFGEEHDHGLADAVETIYRRMDEMKEWIELMSYGFNIERYRWLERQLPEVLSRPGVDGVRYRIGRNGIPTDPKACQELLKTALDLALKVT